MRGWYGHKQQHVLASKGIKSKQYRASGEYDYINEPFDLYIFNKAKKEFGITNDIINAGFILPDGLMLDLTDGNFKLEHDEIYHVGVTLNEFLEMGAIRVGLSESMEYFYIQLNKPLTNAQKRCLSKVIKDYQPTIIIETPITSFEYNEGTYAGTVFRGIEEAMA